MSLRSCVAAFLLSILLVPFAQAQALPPLFPDTRGPVVPGATFWVDVRAGVDTLVVSDLYGASFVLGYDPAVVSVVRSEPGAFLGTDALFFAPDDPDAGTVSVGVSRTNGQSVSGFGVVARVQLRVAPDAAPGTTFDLTLGDVAATNPDGDPVALAPESRTVTVDASAPAESVVVPAPPDSVTPGATFWVDVRAGSDAQPVSDLLGTSFVLAYDAAHLVVVRSEAGSFLGGSTAIYVAENDAGAGEIAVGVSRRDRRGSSGTGVVARVQFRLRDDATPGTSLAFTTSDVDATDPSGASRVLDGGTASARIAGALAPSAPLAPVVPDTLLAGGTFWVDVVVGSAADPVANFYGTSFELRYNPAYLTVIDDQAGSLLGGGPVFIAQDDPDAGHVALGASRSDGRGVTGTGTVARVQFRVDAQVPMGTPLTFSTAEVEANDPSGATLVLESRSAVSVVAASVPAVSVIAPEADSPQPTGGAFWVDVRAGTSQAPLSNFLGTSFVLRYDPSVLTVVSDAPGGFLGSSPVYFAQDDPDAGTVSIGASRRFGTNGSGVVARVEFVLDVDAADQSVLPFRIEDVTAVDASGGSLVLDPLPLDVTVNGVDNPVPAIAGVAPAQAEQGETLDVAVDGTGFFEGVTDVAVGGTGVTVDAVRIDTPRRLTATLSVAPAAAPGARDLVVTNGLPGGGASDPAAFTVVDVPDRPVPTLGDLAPAEGVQGDTVAVTLTGTGFVVGASTVAVSGSGVAVDSVAVASATKMIAVLRIAPAAPVGERTVRVVTRAPGGGTSGGLPFTVRDATPRPDLVVRDVQAPTQARFGETIDVGWTVENVGTTGTGSATWFDRVYLSSTPELDPRTARVLATVENVAALSSGTSENAYANQISIRLPSSLEGTFYVFVRTDAFRSVFEWDASNNDARAASPLAVDAPPLPDLRVVSVAAPSLAFTRDTVTVSWTVENQGDGPTDVADWFDSVYLSTDDRFDFAFTRGTDLLVDDPLLGVASHAGMLAPGDTYTGSTSVVLPPFTTGPLTLFVYTDFRGERDAQDGNVFEFRDAFNNWTGRPIEVTLRPPPNLRVTALDAPDEAISGDTITVAWTVANAGPGRTFATAWTDALWLSTDAVLDGDDRRLLGRQRLGPLLPDSSYTVTAQVPLSHRFAGDFTLLVASDESDRVFENDVEDDNRRGTPITLTPTPPDLVVTSVSVPDSARSGEPLALAWTVQNQGSGPTYDLGWTDRVYLSPEPTFDANTATLLTATTRIEPLVAGASYTVEATPEVPDGRSGDLYVFVETDATDTVFEFVAAAESNNRTRSPSPVAVTLTPPPNLRVTRAVVPDTVQAGQPALVQWTVTNVGTGGSGPVAWTDRVFLSAEPVWSPAAARLLGSTSRPTSLAPDSSYDASARVVIPASQRGATYVYVVTDADDAVFEFDGEDDNVTRASTVSGGGGGDDDVIDIDPYPPVDLVVDALVPPDTASSGQLATVSWRVINQGEAPPQTSTWSDAVYLSTDATLSPATDVQLGTVPRRETLDAGASYTRTETFRVPNGVFGRYYLIVANAVADDDPTNNVARSAGRIDVGRTPAPDLAVRAVTAPAGGTAGQPVDVSWTVENQGEGAPQATDWFDAVYLSADDRLGRNDVLLGSERTTGSLAPGQRYTVDRTVDLPASVEGERYLLVRTDRGGGVYEEGRTANNVAATRVVVTQPPPGDLVVTGVTAPATATPGAPLTVSWTLENQGPNRVRGRLRDAVYVSTDAAFQVSDPLLALQERTVDLAPGATAAMSATVSLAKTYRLAADGTVTEALPGVVPGDYRVLVRTDVRNNVVETDDANNTGATATPTTVDVPTLPLGGRVDSTLTAEAEHFFRIDAAPDRDVRLTLTGTAGASNAVYVARDRAPSRIDFDFAAETPFESDQTLLLPALDAGRYYVLVQPRATSTPKARDAYTLTAEALAFGVDLASPSEAGVGGRFTTTVRGAGFSPDSRVFLRNAFGDAIPGEITEFVNRTELRVRFDLETARQGDYELAVERPQSAFASSKATPAPNRVAVIRIGPVVYDNVTTEISGPTVVRRGSQVEYSVTVTNDNNIDADFLVLRVVVPGGEAVSVTSNHFFGQPLPDGLLSASGFRAGVRIGGFGVITAIAKNVPAGEKLKATVRLEGGGASVTGPEAPFIVSAKAIVFEEFVLRYISTVISLRDALLRLESGQLEPQIRDYLKNDGNFQQDMDALRASGLLDQDAYITAETIGQPTVSLLYRPDYAVEVPPSPRDPTLMCEDYFALAGAASAVAFSIAGVAAASSSLGYATAAVGLGFALVSATETVCGVADLSCNWVLELQNEDGYAETKALLYLNNVEDALKEIFAYARKELLVKGAASFIDLATQAGEFLCVFFREAIDPNDILGPDGVGDARWVRAGASLPYTIRFENDPERATAPAQVVRITQTPDVDLDPASVRLGRVGFGPFVFDVPPGRAFYSARLQTSDSLGVDVDVAAGLDVATNTLFWEFRSVDPVTGLPPTDPLAGFLPVNDDAARGEGFVTYTIRPQPDAPSGARIDAEADIVFDVNAPIVTPPIFNTLDAAPPVSRADSTVDFVGDTGFLVRWTRTDDVPGSGAERVDLYQSVDGGPFLPVERALADTAAVVNGVRGTSYRFYTRATDAAGNVEPPKTAAEATVLVGSTVTVVPGDTNADGTVDQDDVLPLGTYFGRTGPERLRASGFQAEPAFPWTPRDATFADANGSGTVDQNDLLPIGTFFDQTVSTSLASAKRAAPGASEHKPMQTLALPPLPPGTVIPIHVNAGPHAGHKAAPPDVRGVSAALGFPPDVFRVRSVTPAADLDDGRLLPFVRRDDAAGRVALAFTRTAGRGGVSVEAPTTLATVELVVARTMRDVATVTLLGGAVSTPAGLRDASGAVVLTSPQALPHPDAFTLEPNYPNPFRTSTVFRFALPRAAPVTLQVYDVLGRRVATIKDDAPMEPGWHAVRFDARLASGVYFCRMRAGDFTRTQKMVVVR